jgi:hypothetical protein
MNTPYQGQQPVTDYGHGFSRLKYSATLIAATSTAFTVPGDSPRYKAVIQIVSTVAGSLAPGWMALGVAASAPAGDAFASTDSEMIQPSVVYCREVKADDVIEFLHPEAAHVSIVLYSL